VFPLIIICLVHRRGCGVGKEEALLQEEAPLKEEGSDQVEEILRYEVR